MGNPPQPCKRPKGSVNANKSGTGCSLNSRDSYFDEDLVFSIELQSHYI